MKNQKNVKVAALFLLSFLVITFAMLPIYQYVSEAAKSDVEVLSEGWTLECPQGKRTNADLDNAGFDFSALKIGDKVTISRVLPPDVQYQFPAIEASTRFSSIEVYVDDKQIFSHDTHKDTGGLFVQSGIHIVELPSDYAGKQLTISYTVQALGAFSGLHTPLLGNYLDISQFVMADFLLHFITATLLVLYGLMLISLTAIFKNAVPSQFSYYAAAALSLAVGLWILSHFDVLSMVYRQGHDTWVEYLVQYSMPLIITLYLYSIRGTSARDFIYLRIAIGVSVSGLIFIVVFMLAPLRVAVADTVFLIEVLVITALTIKYGYSCRNELRNESVLLQAIGVTVLGVCIIGHAIYSVVVDPLGSDRGLIGRNLLLMGGSFYVETQLLNYYMFVTRVISGVMEQGRLTKNAYRDFLTGIPNRAFYNNELDRIREADGDFAIAIVDINGLKHVNDHLGHGAGDHLIVETARILTNVFKDECSMARLGGDEFALVFDSISEETLKTRFDMVESQMDEHNRLEPEIVHSAAFGYAWAHEIGEDGSDPAAVMSLADSRMYEMKRKQHQELGLELRS